MIPDLFVKKESGLIVHVFFKETKRPSHLMRWIIPRRRLDCHLYKHVFLLLHLVLKKIDKIYLCVYFEHMYACVLPRAEYDQGLLSEQSGT